VALFTFKKKELMTLFGTAWLNDTIMEAYMHLLKQLNPDKLILPYFPSPNNTEHVEDGIWTYSSIMAVRHTGNHFVLMEFLKTGEIRYFDSIQANEINNAIVNTTVNRLKTLHEEEEKILKFGYFEFPAVECHAPKELSLSRWIS